MNNNMNNIRGSFKFYQDNNPKHKSRIVQEYLLYNCLKVLHPLPSITSSTVTRFKSHRKFMEFIRP